MISLFSTAFLFLVFVIPVFAHEEGSKSVSTSWTDWVGPLVGLAIIAGAIIIALLIRKKSSHKQPAEGSSRQIINYDIHKND